MYQFDNVTTTTKTPIAARRPARLSASLLPWINRALEALWLLATILVPLAFFGQDFAISEARISYLEVPKVALLRAVAGLMAVLWTVEWALTGRTFQDESHWVSKQQAARWMSPSNVVNNLRNCLKVHPTRWLALAAALFFSSTLISMVLSGSLSTSMWGEIPGQDGYSAYTIVSYFVLFSVIATHLRSRAQLGRLMGSLVVMGSLVGLYGILQHYGYDFLNLTETTGGGSSRVTIFMGNAIFAGAVLSMTVPVTLLVAALTLRDEPLGVWRPLERLRQWKMGSIVTLLWAVLLGVQLLGLMFTYSRGPWSGTILALGTFLGLVLFAFGWRTFIQTGLILGLAGIFALALLQSLGNILGIGGGAWFGAILGLAGAAGAFAALSMIDRFGRAIGLIAAVGVVSTILGMAVLGPSGLSGGSSVEPLEGRLEVTESSAQQAGERLSSVTTDVLEGFDGGRSTHWKVSWNLIKDRPWFEFDQLHLSWLRHLIGYGPDLFRYTYLLESPPDVVGFLPLEPDHAHNFFIHQTVEQGILGGISSLALFGSVFGIVVYHIRRLRDPSNSLYRLVMIGLTAVILGRFLEMMVGVARVSDLTVLWVLLAMFIAAARFDKGGKKEDEPETNQPLITQTARRNPRRLAPVGVGLVLRLAILGAVMGGIMVVTWQKNINYVRGAVAEGQAMKHFIEGDLENTIKDLDRAIKLAPGVPNYYNNRAQVFLAYQLRVGEPTEPSCREQSKTPYFTCLEIESLKSNLQAVDHQPFNHRARLALGNSAFNMQLNDLAVKAYTDASNMVPYAWEIRNDLAESLIVAGFYREALEELDWGLGITGVSFESTRGIYLKGRVMWELGRLEEALETLKGGLSLHLASESAEASLDLVREINGELGISLDVRYFDELIAKDPGDVVAIYNRGLAHLTLGNYSEAIQDIDKAVSGGLIVGETRGIQGYASYKVGDIGRAQAALSDSLLDEPRNALPHAYLGELNMSLGNYAQALNHLEDANVLDVDLGLAHLVRAKIFMSVGMDESAEKVLKSSGVLELPAARDYADRGEIQAAHGEFDLALSDLNDAIRINPDIADFYNIRAKIRVNMGEFDLALADFDSAIDIESESTEYRLNRGILLDLMGYLDRASADLEMAHSLGAPILPANEDRNLSFFAFDSDLRSSEVEGRMRLKLKKETQALRDIEFYSLVAPTFSPGSEDYETALQILGWTYLSLGMWEKAIVNLDALIDVSPTRSDAYRQRGDANLALARYEEAFKEYDSAVGLDQFNSENFVARGKGYAALGKYELARSDFENAIKLDASSSNAYKLRGFLSVQTGDPSGALPDLARAIEILPVNDDAYFKRATAYTEIGEMELALRDLNQAIRLAPTKSVYLHARGLIHYQSGEYESAVEDFQGAIDLQKGFVQVDLKYAGFYYDRGMAHLKLGNVDQALADGKTATAIIAENFLTPNWSNRRSAVDLQLGAAHLLILNASGPRSGSGAIRP